MFKAYYRLTKPGIIYGNLLTAAAGFLLASKWHIDADLFIATLAGTALVIASACVVNNYLDREIDTKMARTKQRALVQGTIPIRNAISFATILAVVGFELLALYTNALVVIIGLVAFLDYIVLYGLAKRHSVHGTLVGSIAGAVPIVAGYCAVTDRFDSGALLLGLILVTWQMPHFYAIAMYRFKDYKAAGLPVLPVKKGLRRTKVEILIYIAAFTLATIALTVQHYTGYTYMAVMLIVGLYWLQEGITGFNTTDDTGWARRMFFFSLIVLLVFCVALSVGALLP